MTFKQLHKSHRIISLFLIFSFTHSALSSADTAVRTKTSNGIKLNLKAWISGPTQALKERHSFGKANYLYLRLRYKPSFHRLRVKAVKEDRHVIYIEKETSLEEMVSDKSLPPEDGVAIGKESDFEEVELRVPAHKTYGFSLGAENEGSAFENYDDEDLPRSSGELPPKSIFATINHTEEEAEPVNNSYDMMTLPPQPPQLNVERAWFDTAVLEKELMIKTMDTNIEQLKEKLKNTTKLEGSAGNWHRDYGSSYILPVLSSINYDNNTVPTAFSDVPVIVVVKMNVLYLANFDSELMEYSIDVEMQLSWFDLRLANNYTKPIRIREKQILDLIWKPDPYFVNSKYSYFHAVSFPNFRMRIYPDGLVKYTMRVTSVCNCFMLFCLYPHDRQTCDLRISSIAYPSAFVHFVWHSDPISFQSDIALPELHVQHVWTDRCNVEGKLIRSSCLRLVFELERDGARFVVEKYIPSTLAMMFAWVAPYVPYNYEDVRIITPITVLLTLVQMGKGDKEIRTSYLTSMDVWFAAMKGFTVISLLESLVVLALIKRSRAMEKNMQRAITELERENFKLEKHKLTRLYHRLDSMCRFISPIVFVLFFVYYVLFVAQGDERGCVVK